MTAQDVLERIYASLPEVHCKRLCGRKICGPIVAFPIEIERMARAAGYPLTYLIRNREAWCGYFDQVNSLCTVHAARPLICRLYGVVQDPRMICPFGCVPDRWVTDSEVTAMLTLLETVTGTQPIQGDER